MHLTNKVLSKKCKTQKNTHSLNLFIYNSKKGKTILFKDACTGTKIIMKSQKIIIAKYRIVTFGKEK